jgi:P2-related tail formation protein
MSDELPVPYGQLMDPYQTPAQFLPWLAAHYSIDLWYEDWPEARKREIIARSSGRSVVHSGEWLAELKGSVAAAPAYLSYVDAQIIHKVSHPARFPVGRIAAGVTPIQHKPFVARWLLKVDLTAPANAVCAARTAVGRAAVRTINREPMRRAKATLSASKAPETAYTVNFAHRVPVTLDDGFDLDAGHVLGSFKDRIRL